MPDRPPASLGELLDRVRKASGKKQVSVEDIIGAVGRHSLLPLMIVPAALAATPLSGIPGLTAVTKAILMVVIVIVVLDGLYKLIRLLTGRPFSPKEIFKSRPA